MASNFECSGGPRRRQDSTPALPRSDPPHRIQEPVKPKRRSDVYSEEVIWLLKRQRPPVVAESGHDQVNCDAAPSSPIVREQDGNMGAPGVDRRSMEEEKVRPCEFPATPYGLDVMQKVQKPVKRDHHQDVDEECWLIKKSYHSARVNSAAPSMVKIHERKAVTARRRRRRNTKPSPDCETYVSLASGLRYLGVTTVIPVLARVLTRTDSLLSQARLQISSLELMQSPLGSMLTPAEYAKVHTEDGLPVEALDRHGCSYDMRLGFVWLSSNISYRLRRGWTRFLARSGVREGDLVQIGAFRVHGRLMLTLLNYAVEGSIPEEMEAADGLLMLSAGFKDGTKS